MVQATAAAQIVHLIGMPEGLFPLSQATIYLANAPRSNALLRAYRAAAADATATAREPVPLHLRNAVALRTGGGSPGPDCERAVSGVRGLSGRSAGVRDVEASTLLQGGWSAFPNWRGASVH